MIAMKGLMGGEGEQGAAVGGGPALAEGKDDLTRIANLILTRIAFPSVDFVAISRIWRPRIESDPGTGSLSNNEDTNPSISKLRVTRLC